LPVSVFSLQYAVSFHTFRPGPFNPCNSQAAKDVRASQDTLIDIFERIEGFFRHLEIYADVPPTPEMTYIIIQMMVEVLCILGIVTNEIKQGRKGEQFT
jgi:hypothetical protein